MSQIKQNEVMLHATIYISHKKQNEVLLHATTYISHKFIMTNEIC
jgi:hypothetical protein